MTDKTCSFCGKVKDKVYGKKGENNPRICRECVEAADELIKETTG